MSLLKQALGLTRDRSVDVLATLALARAGPISQAQQLAADLSRQFPSDTRLNYYWLPSIRAAITLNRHNPARALEELEPAAHYELGTSSPVASATVFPVYLRGLALLASGQASQAAAEFQKLLDHPGVPPIQFLCLRRTLDLHAAMHWRATAQKPELLIGTSLHSGNRLTIALLCFRKRKLSLRT